MRTHPRPERQKISESKVREILAHNLSITEGARRAGISPSGFYRRGQRLGWNFVAARTQQRRAEARRARAALGREPRNLQEWWPTQTEFASQGDFARAIGVCTRSVVDWCNGAKTPTGERRRKLYAITGLAAYAPMNGAAPGLVPILEDARNFVASTVLSRNGRYFLNHYFDQCFGMLAENGVSNLVAVSPDVLLRFAPRVGRTRWALGFVGRFLARTAWWTAVQHAEFNAELARIFPTPSRIQNAPRYKPVPLLAQLVERLGFSTRELLNMRMPKETENGLRLSDGRLIAFGDELHQVSRDAWLNWTSRERPTVFLFFQRLPTQRDRPVGRVWLTQTLRASGVAANRRLSSAMRHFEADFRANPNLRWLRLHFQGFHRMDHQRARRILDRLHEKFGVHVPAPYLWVILAVSRLLPDSPAVSARGTTRVGVWPDIRGYKVEVRWPITLFQALADGRVQPGVARELVRLATQAWRDQGLFRSCGAFKQLDSSLARSLARVHVSVSETRSTRVWQANLLGPRVYPGMCSGKQSKYFELPLLELLQGGPLNPHCEVCCHSERENIDEAIRARQPKPKFSEIAKRYAVGYYPLLCHAGRLTVKGRKIRSHVGAGFAGRSVSVPSRFLARAARYNGPNLATEMLSLGLHSKGV